MLNWLIASGVFLLALVQNLGAVEHSPFHPDETRWLNRAHYVSDLTDPFGPTWAEGYLTRGQPPLGSYLMGAGLLVQGRDLDTNGVWDFRHDAAWNRARGNMASSADLTAGRRANAMVGALAVAVVYLAGARLTNRVGGVAGGLLLGSHPLMIMLASQALSDALLVLLLAVALLAGCRLGERPGWGSALVLGAALGLGGATKLSPLLLSLPLAGLGFVMLRSRLRQRWSSEPDPIVAKLGAKAAELNSQTPINGATSHPRRQDARHNTRTFGYFNDNGRCLAGVIRVPAGWCELRSAALAPSLADGATDPAVTNRRLAWFLLAIPAIAAIVFVAAYPYLWPDPIGRTAGLFTFRVEEMARQGENWTGVAVDSRLEAARRVGDRLGGDYSGSGRIADWLQGADLVAGGAGLLLLAGLALCRRRDGRYLIPLILVIGQAGVILLGLRSDYARYYLPLVLVMACGVSVGAGLSWQKGSRFAIRYWPLLRQLPRRLPAAPAFSAVGWWVGGTGLLLALLGSGSALGDDLPEIVALPATPVARGTPVGDGTPLVATPGATPLTGAAATPVMGTPLASPGSAPRATPKPDE